MASLTNRLTVYGTDWCKDTKRARRFLEEREVPYRYVDIEQDPESERMIREMNQGRVKTPTLVFENEEKAAAIEPADEELDRLLRGRGYLA